MEAVYRTRHETSLHLMFSLSPGLDAHNAVLNGVLDKLIIAELKMKTVIGSIRAPIAPIQVLTFLKREAGRRDGVIFFRCDQESTITEALRNTLKKRLRKVRRTPLSSVG